MPTKMTRRAMEITLLTTLSSGWGVVAGGAQQQSPPIPSDVPVWMVGSPNLDGRALSAYSEARFAMGRSAKSSPHPPGESLTAAAFQVLSLVPDRQEGRDVWIRSFRTVRPDGEVVAEGSIVLDRRTLAPIRSTVERGYATTSFRYDWDRHVVERFGDVSSDGENVAERLDLVALEAATHETWMAAIAWRPDMRVMLPTILAGGGGKWWAVPRVVGTASLDLGDGVERGAWVVDVDWWGMGADHLTFTPGARPDGSAGPGGKYWILREPAEGTPRVVRVQTEVSEDLDQVLQLDIASAR